MNKCRIVLRSFKKKNLDDAISFIFSELKKKQFYFSNCFFLPIKREKFTILISPHVDKNARDQYEIKTYKVFFDIYDDYEKVQPVISNFESIPGIEISTRSIG